MKDDKERENGLKNDTGEPLPWWETKTVEVTMEGLRFGRRLLFWAGIVTALGATLLLLGALALFHLGYRPDSNEHLKAELREWASPQSMEATSDSVNILSLNFNHGAGPDYLFVEHGEVVPIATGAIKERLDKLAALLRKESVDVIMLQGVDFDSEYSGSFDQVEYLASQLKWGYVVKAHTWRHPFLPFPDPLDGKMIGKVEMGLAIISRLPLFNAERYALPGETLDNWWKTTFAPSYCVLKVELTAAGKHLFLYNTELTAGDQLDRERQAREVASVVSQTSSGRGVLAGTFWAEPKTKEVEAQGERVDCTMDLVRHRMNFSSLFKDWELARDRDAYVTFTGPDRVRRVVDYVLPERKIEVRRWYRIDVEPPISAHMPILLEVFL